ncbi:MAG: zinc ABC transporter substrate-binding protein [Sedimentisphaerales bacterium]|nr:zinc ABC transporter substrate-binding protein [Sedimentisphaerales bacterium]
MRIARIVHILMILAFMGLAVGGCRDRGAPEGAYDVAVTNSYLGCVVRDLCGTELDVLCLAPPGMCPGHFDISPAQVGHLHECRMLLLFDFQQNIEQTLARLKENGLRTCRIQTPPGLCVPETYLIACEQVAEALTERYPERADQFAQRLGAIQTRLSALSETLQAQVRESQAASAKVLTSNHQAAFSKWLGLETVATFVGSDTETVANIDHCLRQAAGQDVRFVIANRQEGTALAEALAQRLQARALVFSNFPRLAEGVAGFDQLLCDNVGLLVEAVTR